jgi:hypothetical protein
MEGTQPRMITVDEFAEATFGAVLRAVDARRARASDPTGGAGLPPGLAGALGYPVVVYGIIAGPGGWPWGAVPAAIGGFPGPTGASGGTSHSGA